MPRTLIERSVCPLHFTVALLNVVFVVALKLASSCPLEFTIPVLHIINVVPLVLIYFALLFHWFLPNTFALLLTLLEDAAVDVAVGPPVLPHTLCDTVPILAQVYISICEHITALTVSKRVAPLAFKSVAVGPLVHTISVSHVYFPLTNIATASCVFPHAIAMFKSIKPIPIIGVSVDPLVNTFTLHLTFIVISKVDIPVTKPLIALSVSFVLEPGSLKVPRIVVYTNSKASSLVSLLV
jgi:hypothetical protein